MINLEFFFYCYLQAPKNRPKYTSNQFFVLQLTKTTILVIADSWVSEYPIKAKSGLEHNCFNRRKVKKLFYNPLTKQLSACERNLKCLGYT